jgi:multidrug efflux pump subunit AcrA (membrane-fusion protein)
MVAFVTSETQKDVAHEGKVAKIDTVANAGQGRWWGGDDVKRFKVEVELQAKEHTLKPGTSARVEIQVGEVPDVLAVPLQAIFPSEGRHFVYRANGGKPERIEVEPGRSNETHVEVKTGLEEGDVVLLDAPDVGEGGEAEGARGPSAPAKGP